MKDEKDQALDGLPGYLVKVYKNQAVFNSSPIFLLTTKRNLSGTFSLALIEPNTNQLRIFKDLVPDLGDSSHFLILNNDADNRKYETIIQLKCNHLDETSNQTKKHIHSSVGADLE